MTTEDPVERALAAVADAEASRHAPPHLERAVMDALDRQMNRGYFERCIATALTYAHAAAIALVAIVATTIFFAVLGQVLARRPPTTQRVPDTPPIEVRSGQTGADTISAAQREGADVAQRVLVRLPRSMLPMLGVPIINPDAPGTVNLEVILHEDGLARTIRVVP